MVVPTASSVPADINSGGRLVDLRLGDECASALALEMDLLGVILVESICAGLDLVLVHRLSHLVKHPNLDVGGGVVLIHD